MTYLIFLLASLVFLGLWLSKLIMAWYFEAFRRELNVRPYGENREMLYIADTNPGVMPSRPFYFAAWFDFGTALMCAIVGLCAYLAEGA